MDGFYILPIGWKTMALEPPSLKPEQASNLALVLALMGLALVYFWPTGSDYKPVALAQIILQNENQWVRVSGTVLSVTPKPSGYSLRLCDSGCASVSVGEGPARAFSSDGLPPPKGSTLTVLGQVATYQNNKFIRADKMLEG